MLTDENLSHLVGDIEVVIGQGTNMKFAVLLRRVYDIRLPIIVFEDGHVSAVAVMRTFTVEILERTYWRIADSHTDRSFRVIGIINMHPHNILAGIVVIDDFRPLEHLRAVEIMGDIRFLSSEDNTLVFPCP